MGTLGVEGAELYYEEHGSGPPLLLVHGTGAYVDLWTPVLDGLARSHRVISYDRRGFGRSSVTRRTRLADHAHDAAALLTALDAGPATVVGWSGGGVIALDLAASYPEQVSALVLAEAAVRLSVRPSRSSLAMQTRSSAQRYLRRDPGAAAQAMYRWSSASTGGAITFDTLPEAWQEQMTRNGPSTVLEMDQLLRPYPSLAAIRSITCPVRVIEGEVSDPVFLRADALIRTLLPQAELVVLPGAAHFLHIDQPEAWVAAVAGSPV